MDLMTTIDVLWDHQSEPVADERAANAIRAAVSGLDDGTLRVAEIVNDQVVVHEWLKRAILLYFSTTGNVASEVGPFEIVDKVPLKRGLAAAGVRALPGSIVRWGAHVEAGAVLMPSFDVQEPEPWRQHLRLVWTTLSTPRGAACTGC